MNEKPQFKEIQKSFTAWLINDEDGEPREVFFTEEMTASQHCRLYGHSYHAIRLRVEVLDNEETDNEFAEAERALLRLEPTGEDINATRVYETLTLFRDELKRRERISKPAVVVNIDRLCNTIHIDSVEDLEKLEVRMQEMLASIVKPAADALEKEGGAE